MLTFDEKRFFAPKPVDPCSPPPRDPKSFPEKIELTSRMLRDALDRLNMFEHTMTEKYNDLMAVMTQDNVVFKDLMQDAFSDFVSTVRSEVNLFETNAETVVTLFKEAINAKLSQHETEYGAYQEQLETMIAEYEQQIRAEFQTVSASIEDAIRFMRANLNTSLENLLYEMRADGSITGVIESSVFTTLERYGGIGDGTTDNTEAFNSAIAENSVIVVPKGVHVINGTVLLNKTVSILGYGDESVLRINGTIKSDNNLSHTIKISNLRIENYKTTGNAIEIVKLTSANGGNCLTIDNVRFFANNNISASFDSNVLYLEGVREATIQNCVFEGKSSAYGTAVKINGKNGAMSVNVTIANCHFYSYLNAIHAETTADSIVYLAGIRIVNNTILGCGYGVRAVNVDTMFVHDNMIDYVERPIHCETVGRLTAKGNYLQTIRAYPCVYLANNRVNDISMIDVSENYMWCATDNKEASGIVFNGAAGKISYSVIERNCFNALNECISLTGCQGIKVADSTAKNCSLFYNGNDSTIVDLIGNYAEATVNTFMSNFHASGMLKNNRHGVRFDSNRGKIIEIANGNINTFKAEHKLFKQAQWGIGHIGASDMVNNPFSVTYDDTYIYFKFANSPANGETVVINWECGI